MILVLKNLLLLFVLLVSCDGDDRKIYLVLLEGDPIAFHHVKTFSQEGNELDPNSEASKAYANELTKSHDEFLQSNLERGSYDKIYSFKHIINGVAVHTTPSQIEKLKNAPRVKLLEEDRRVKQMTTYTPQFLGIPAVWTQEGGDKNAGEGIVIGFIDSGINPDHPSFAYDPMTNSNSFTDRACEEGPLFPQTSCNGKIVSARFFSAGAQTSTTLNESIDILSPFDAVGHGSHLLVDSPSSLVLHMNLSVHGLHLLETGSDLLVRFSNRVEALILTDPKVILRHGSSQSHVASTAAGNFGVPVVVNGLYYGRASGMAPRARIAVYKAIYPSIGTLSDVLAAIDQAVLDGVDILTLSVGPEEPPEDKLTFLSLFEIFMLAAHKAGTLVVQAAGNEGPSPYSVISYSPWAVGVASCDTDRTYPATLILGNGLKIAGVGLSGATVGDGLMIQYNKLVLAKDAIKINTTLPRIANNAEECQYPEAFDPLVVQDSVVICTFSAGFYNGTSTLTAIIQTASVLRFKAFVFVSNPMYGDFIAEPIPFATPAIMIPATTDTQNILQYYEKETVRDTNGLVVRYGGRAGISEGRNASYKGRAPIVSRFSSRGPDYIDQSKNPTDVLKPDILAPGHQIWAAWSPMSILDPILSGHNFALMSGTSMATPHIAGVAAMIKQYNPSWTPSMIASAISTTASTYDNLGEPIMAHGFDLYTLHISAPFGFGAGLVNPSRALHPGLVFSAGYEDYISFLCSLPNIDSRIVKTATGGICGQLFENPSDLNLPSITITSLNGSRIVHRTVTNVESKAETYLSAVLPPKGVTVNIEPSWFIIAPQGTQDLHITFNVTQALDDFTFGEIVLTGSLNHVVKMPLSIFPISTT